MQSNLSPSSSVVSTNASDSSLDSFFTWDLRPQLFPDFQKFVQIHDRNNRCKQINILALRSTFPISYLLMELGVAIISSTLARYTYWNESFKNTTQSKLRRWCHPSRTFHLRQQLPFGLGQQPSLNHQQVIPMDRSNTRHKLRKRLNCPRHIMSHTSRPWGCLGYRL